MSTNAEHGWKDGGRPTGSSHGADALAPREAPRIGGRGRAPGIATVLFHPVLKELAVRGAVLSFGQEYVFFKGPRPLGSAQHQDLRQAVAYGCAGVEEVLVWKIVELHLERCVEAGLAICRAGAAEVPGQWRFEVGPVDVVTGISHLEAARSLLRRTAAEHGIQTILSAAGCSWRTSGDDSLQ